MRVLYPGQIGIGFCGGKETRESRENPQSKARTTTNSTHVGHQAGIEPGPH